MTVSPTVVTANDAELPFHHTSERGNFGTVTAPSVLTVSQAELGRFPFSLADVRGLETAAGKEYNRLCDAKI
jgi:hypothetical protein